MSIRVPVLRRISMNFQARFPSQPIQLFSHQVGLFETRPPWNPRSIWSYDPYVVYVSWWFTITFPIQLASSGFKALIFRPRQLHLQMEGLDRPKVGEWRDTKGFYGASIPLAWAQAWTTRWIRNRWLAMMIFSDTNRKPHKIKHKIKVCGKTTDSGTSQAGNEDPRRDVTLTFKMPFGCRDQGISGPTYFNQSR